MLNGVIQQPGTVIPIPASTNTFTVPTNAVPFKSNVRNARSHIGYVGVQDALRPDLTATVKVGARYTDNYNDPSQASDVAPYADLKVNYSYLPGSSLEGGFTYDYSATDRLNTDVSGQIAQYQEAATVYA